MKRLDRYIGKIILLNMLAVLLVLIGLFTFFTFIEEIDDIGTGHYGAFQALQYVALHIPRRIHELFPVVALLGSLLGLGLLANTSELTVMRAAGVSVARILWAAIKATLILLIVAIVLGEKLAPQAEQYAKKLRSLAKSEHIALQTPYGFWARDGDSFVNVRGIQAGGRLSDVSMYRFSGEKRLEKIIHARRAYYQQGRWVLEELVETRLRPERVETFHKPRATWDSLLSPGLVGILILEPDKLSTLELYHYIQYLKQNGLRAAQYQLAFWQKVFYPLTAGVMIFLAVPFVFGSQRNVSMSQRILIGALLGIGFHIFNQAVGHLGLLYNFNPFLSAALPTLLFFLLGWGLMRYRVR